MMSSVDTTMQTNVNKQQHVTQNIPIDCSTQHNSQIPDPDLLLSDMPSTNIEQQQQHNTNNLLVPGPVNQFYAPIDEPIIEQNPEEPEMEVDQTIIESNKEDNNETHSVSTVLEEQPKARILYSQAVTKDLTEKTKRIPNRYYNSNKKKE